VMATSPAVDAIAARGIRLSDDGRERHATRL
jgi:hypothetical protein